MGLLDVLNQYAQHPDRPPPHVFEDFDRVAREVDPDDLSYGLEDAFQSDATPPFEQMVGQLYEQSDDDTRAGLLNEILGSLGGGQQQLGGGGQSFGGGQQLGGGLGGALAGGVLGSILARMGQGNPRVSPRDAHQVPAREIEFAAREAAQRNPGVVQRVSRFYARNPQLVRVLGQAALGILMSGMARRRRV